VAAERAVFDSNIWVSSSLYPGSVPYRAIDLARRGHVRSVLSDPIIEQVKGALAGPKFRYSPVALAAVEAEMRRFSEIVAPGFTLAEITAKESDNRILECAVAGEAAVIVTGDRRHLLPLGAFRGIAIVSPGDFLHGRGG
jgi:putative PIN family toxin of toxin-antitoxin system